MCIYQVGAEVWKISPLVVRLQKRAFAVVATMYEAHHLSSPFVEFVVTGHAEEVAPIGKLAVWLATGISQHVEKSDTRFILHQGGLRLRGPDMIPCMKNECTRTVPSGGCLQICSQNRSTADRSFCHGLTCRYLTVEIVDGKQMHRDVRAMVFGSFPLNCLLGLLMDFFFPVGKTFLKKYCLQ